MIPISARSIESCQRSRFSSYCSQRRRKIFPDRAGRRFGAGRGPDPVPHISCANTGNYCIQELRSTVQLNGETVVRIALHDDYVIYRGGIAPSNPNLESTNCATLEFLALLDTPEYAFDRVRIKEPSQGTAKFSEIGISINMFESLIVR
jgi:hypothetical protein